MKYLLTFAFLLLVSFYSCNKNNDVTAPGKNEWSATKFIDSRCPEGLAGTLSEEFTETAGSGHYLNYWNYRDDTLKLHLLFDCTCYSAFQDSAVIGDGWLHIFLKDTSGYHARCICSHASELDFFLPGASQVGMQLNIQFYGSENYAACLDTLLEIGL
ncbi:MAG: hypothetical protein GXO74_02515 [Calditrichaeota bacterium]|nr:hypothetical protein [Calditrichota bacterium]